MIILGRLVSARVLSALLLYYYDTLLVSDARRKKEALCGREENVNIWRIISSFIRANSLKSHSTNIAYIIQSSSLCDWIVLRSSGENPRTSQKIPKRMKWMDPPRNAPIPYWRDRQVVAPRALNYCDTIQWHFRQQKNNHSMVNNIVLQILFCKQSSQHHPCKSHPQLPFLARSMTQPAMAILVLLKELLLVEKWYTL